jgi:hypothetical protein
MSNDAFHPAQPASLLEMDVSEEDLHFEAAEGALTNAAVPSTLAQLERQFPTSPSYESGCQG